MKVGVFTCWCGEKRRKESGDRSQKETVNPFLVEVANIREHCYWVHPNKDEATAKASELAI